MFQDEALGKDFSLLGCPLTKWHTLLMCPDQSCPSVGSVTSTVGLACFSPLAESDAWKTASRTGILDATVERALQTPTSSPA